MSRRNVLALLIAVLAAGFLAWRAGGEASRKLFYPDAFHYAELGRQVARGEGFTSLQAYPYSLAWLHHAGLSLAPPWPNVSRFPLVTMLYAPIFGIGGATEAMTLVVGSVAFVLSAAATFLLGARLFGTGIGIAAAIVFGVDLTQVAYARSGLLETPAAFFIVAPALVVAWLLDARADEPAARRVAVLLGLVLGLGFLLRYDLLAMTGAAVLVLTVGRGRIGRRQVAWVLLAAALPVGIWVLRNLVAVGSPFVFLGFDRNVLATRRLVDVYAVPVYEGVWSVLARRPEILTGKLGGVFWPLHNWWNLFGPQLLWLGPLFIGASVILLVRRHRALRVWTFVVLGFVLRVLILTATHHEGRFYVSFVPVALVFALGGSWTLLLTILLERVRRFELAIALIAVVAYVGAQRLPRGPRWNMPVVESTPDEPQGEPAPSPEDVFDLLRQYTPKDTVIATTRSERVAWYAERPAIRVEAVQLAAVEKLGVRIDGLVYRSKGKDYVTRALARQGLSERFVLALEGEHLSLWLDPRLAQRVHDAQENRDARHGAGQAG